MTEVLEQPEERVMDMVAKFLDVDRSKVTLTSDFVRDLGADSLDLVELVMALEDEFDREISDEQASNIRTVQDAVSFIREKPVKDQG